MGTDKFEKHIKAQFKEREIQPSENAWEKLSSELNTDDRKKKPVYLWMGIAASVIVLIGVTMFFFNSGDKVNGTQFKVVETDSKEVLKENVHTEKVPFVEKEQETVATTSDLEKINNVVEKKQEPIKEIEVVKVRS